MLKLCDRVSINFQTENTFQKYANIFQDIGYFQKSLNFRNIEAGINK